MQNLTTQQVQLTTHPVYQTFSNLACLQSFMRYHVFAVWDFMSLLKSLQQKITCVTIPWTPSPYPAEMVRLINQIVVGEESDVDQFGNATSHFDLYLKAMEEIGASTNEIRSFLKHQDLNQLPDGVREFVKHNLNVAKNGHVVEVAASFFFGREKLIPDMFRSIVKILKDEDIEAPTLLYYLERHIEVDDGEHGPLAMKCLDILVDGNESLKLLALKAGSEALKMRNSLWDHVFSELKVVS